MVLFRILERISKQNEHWATYALKQFLTETSMGLKLTFDVEKIDQHGYPWISAEGEDAEAFKEFLNETVGVAPESLGALETKTTGRAIVMHVEKSLRCIVFDVGLTHVSYLAYMPEVHLIMPLAGRRLSFEDAVERLCLIEGVPVDVAFTKVSVGEKKIWVKLSQTQMDSYERWIRMFLDRIIVVNCTRRKLKTALAKTRNMRFVVSVERLGLFCQDIVCKLGIDAGHIQATLAREIPEATSCIFSPPRLLQLQT